MTPGTLHSQLPASPPLWRVRDIVAWIRMFVSFWAFERASSAAFARAPKQNGRTRLMRLDILVLAKLLATAEADFAFWLARRACFLAGMDPDRVTHVMRSAPETRHALKVRARDYFQRFARLEEMARDMAMRMMKQARQAADLVDRSTVPASEWLASSSPCAWLSAPAPLVRAHAQPRAPP